MSLSLTCPSQLRDPGFKSQAKSSLYAGSEWREYMIEKLPAHVRGMGLSLNRSLYGH